MTEGTHVGTSIEREPVGVVFRGLLVDLDHGKVEEAAETSRYVDPWR